MPSRVAAPRTTRAPSTPSAHAQALKTCRSLTRAFDSAADPGHLSNAATDAMKFLTSPAARGLSLGELRGLHVALGEALTSLDASVGWSPKAANGPARALMNQLNSDHPGEMANGVKATVAFLGGPGAARLDSTQRNELFKALGSAQAALGQIEANP